MITICDIYFETAGEYAQLKVMSGCTIHKE